MELLFQLSQLGELPDEAPRLPGAAETESLRALLTDDRSSCYVLDADGEVEGTLTLYILPNLTHGGRPIAIVESVVVDQRAQGSGFGRLLMAYAEAQARAAGCYKIALTSNRRRADAHRFYERLGYERTHQGFTKYFDKEPVFRQGASLTSPRQARAGL
jgi:GNAT superfamily N-acetyltransferase